MSQIAGVIFFLTGTVLSFIFFVRAMICTLGDKPDWAKAACMVGLSIAFDRMVESDLARVRHKDEVAAISALRAELKEERAMILLRIPSTGLYLHCKWRDGEPPTADPVQAYQVYPQDIERTRALTGLDLEAAAVPKGEGR